MSFSSSTSELPTSSCKVTPSSGVEEPENRLSSKFVQDSSKYWYKPGISRDQGENICVFNGACVNITYTFIWKILYVFSVNWTHDHSIASPMRYSFTISDAQYIGTIRNFFDLWVLGDISYLTANAHLPCFYI